MDWILIFIVPFILSVILTPIIKRVAIKINAVDLPNERKVHKTVMPRLGGLAIFLATSIGLLVFTDITTEPLMWIAIGSLVIIIAGIVDDIKPLSPKIKLLFQLAASITVIYGGINIEFINVPLSNNVLYLGNWSYFITVVWIIGITNALNLIDGLDGLSAGVSSISLATIFIMSLSMGNILIATLVLILLAATLGFLIFNFYPAKIFLGDSGSMYLGFFLATLSILGFKNIAVVSFVFPIIILAVPIFDTISAIIRRFRNKTSITLPDKKHLHHCLLEMGFSHRKTVLIIYGISLLFSIAALFLSQATFWIGLIIVALIVVMTLLVVEWTGVVGETRKPLTRFFVGIGNKIFGLNRPTIKNQ